MARASASWPSATEIAGRTISTLYRRHLELTKLDKGRAGRTPRLFGISVEATVGVSVIEACRSSERLAQYRQIRLSTFGKVRGAGFALLATFEPAHFTLVLPDLSQVTLARLERCFDAPIPNPAGDPRR